MTKVVNKTVSLVCPNAISLYKKNITIPFHKVLKVTLNDHWGQILYHEKCVSYLCWHYHFFFKRSEFKQIDIEEKMGLKYKIDLF